MGQRFFPFSDLDEEVFGMPNIPEEGEIEAWAVDWK
jgi:hypothetical protein